MHICLLLRGICAAGREGNLHVVAGLLRSLLDSYTAAQNDQVSKRDLLATGLDGVEILLDRLQDCKNLRQFGRLVDLPILLRRQANARTVGPAALVGAAEGCRRRPGRGDQLRNGKPFCFEDDALQGSNILLPNQFMIHCRHGVLPNQRLLGNKRTEITGERSHIAVRQLEPGLGEGVGEFLRILEEAAGNLLVDRVHPQGEVRREHEWGVLLLGVVGIRHGTLCRCVLVRPLLGAGGALRELPFIAEEVFQVVVVPLHRVRGPCALQAAADGIDAFSAAEAILPAQALLFDWCALGFGADILARIGGAMSLAEGVSAGDEGNRLLVIHCHAKERLPDIPSRGNRIRLAIRSFRIHIDQAHLNSTERILELTVAAVAFVSQPLALGAPVIVFFRLPGVLAPTAETECLESHRLDGHVAGENYQVGPGDLPAVLLLDRPDQPACLVEAHIVRPTIQGSKSLRSGAAAAAAIGDTVGASTMPSHADEEGPIVTVVRRPPIL